MSFKQISWIVTQDPISTKNKYMRHIKDNPIVECKLIDKDEYCRWNGQTMYNLLITLLINQHNSLVT